MHHKRGKPRHQRSSVHFKEHKDERRAKTTRYKGLSAPRKARNPDQA